MSSSSSPPSLSVLLLHLLASIVLLSECPVASASPDKATGSGERVSGPPVYGAVFSVAGHGAVGNGREDDTEAFLSAWREACGAKVPSTMHVPRGHVFMVGPITFQGPCSNPVHVQIEGNITAPGGTGAWSGKEGHTWLVFQDIRGLTISGGGTIDGHGSIWWAKSCKIDPRNPCEDAPSAITVHGCDSVTVSDLRSVNSQQVHVDVQYSSNVSISDLTILAPGDSPNTDGIHIHASHHVYIDNCSISTGDDCISIVTDCYKVVMTNIYCGPGHGISVGSLGKDGDTSTVERIRLKNATFDGTKNGVRIKSWQGGHGYARIILFEQLKFINVSNPIVIDQYYCDSPHPCANKTSAVQVSDVAYIGASGTSHTEKAIQLACSETVSCTGIFFQDVNISTTASGEPTTAYFLNAEATTCGTVLPPLPIPSLETDGIGAEHTAGSTMPPHPVRPQRKGRNQHCHDIPPWVVPPSAISTIPAAMTPEGGSPSTTAPSQLGSAKPLLTSVALANQPNHGTLQRMPSHHPNHGKPSILPPTFPASKSQASSRAPTMNPRHLHPRTIDQHQPNHAIPRTRGS